MKKLFFSILIISLMSAKMPASFPTIGRTIQTDPAFEKLIAPDAKIEVLASGYKWSEGPAWVKKGGYLIFSDVPNNTAYQWSESEGAPAAEI